MTYEEVMAAARKADAAGSGSDARRLLEIALTLPDRPQKNQGQSAGQAMPANSRPDAPSGPWEKYQAQAQEPQRRGPWEKYANPPAQQGKPWEKYAVAGQSATAKPMSALEAEAAIITPPAYFDGTVAPDPATLPQRSENGVLLDAAASGAKGIRDGLTAIPDVAVHAVNNLPRVLNLPKMIPGMEDAYSDVGTITDAGAAFDNWVGGDGTFTVPEGTQTAPVTLQDFTNGFGALDYEPQTGAGRITERIGNEIGASMLPTGAALRYGENFVGNPAVQSTAHEGVRNLVEPFVRNPRAAVSREMAGATAVGTGAGIANEAHDAATGGEGGAWWTDLIGGIGGLGIAGAAEGIGRSVANIGRHVSGSPRFQETIAGETVADRLVDNSTTMQAQRFAGRPLDAEVLADRLDRPTALEGLVPGYRAGTADRSGDSGIRTLAYNTEGLAPGAANMRREQNTSAVGDFIRDLIPDGNAPAFLETVRGRAGQIVDSARNAAGAAQTRLDEALDAARPRMQPIDRGQTIRDDMTNLHGERRAEYQRAYDARDASMANDRIDANAPYRALRDEADRMTTYERDAYVPADIMDSARKIAPDARQPELTGVVDMYGSPIMRPPAQGPARVPLSEALSLRHGLTTRQREARAAGRAPEHRAVSRLNDTLRREIDSAMSPETRALDETARGLRRSTAADFEDGNLPSRILDQTTHDRPRMATEAIGPRVTGTETGYRDTMRLTGSREGTRGAVRDQISADATNAGALRNQDALNRFLADRAYQFDDFPDVRDALEAAGASRAQLDQAEAFVRTQEGRYAPGSNSPVGRFARHDDTGIADAMRGVWKSSQPRQAIKEVLDTAGRTPANLKNARSAFFEDLARTTTNSAHDAAGNIVWNGRTLDGFLKNPKVQAVMDELWEGSEDHLKDLREIGSALIDSESALRAKPPASSGTAAISLQGKIDPALTATSISSTLRSVQRGQMSKPIAGIHLLAGWIRGRSAKVQAAAINELMTKAMDDPTLAAAILRKHNPYDGEVMGRRFLRKWGMRVPHLANIVNEELGGYDEKDRAFDEFVGAE